MCLRSLVSCLLHQRGPGCPLHPSPWLTERERFQNGKIHGGIGVVTFTDGDTITGTMHNDRPSKRVLTN